MNVKKLLISSVLGFIFVFIFQMLWHQMLMRGLYEEFMYVWRPPEESNMGIGLLSILIFSVSINLLYANIGVLFTKCKRGIGFGIMAGLVLAGPNLMSYVYLPISMTISLLWIVGGILESLGVSMIAAKLIKK